MEGKRRFSDIESPSVELMRDAKKIRDDSESLDDEGGTKLFGVIEELSGFLGVITRRSRQGSTSSHNPKQFKTIISMLHTTISQHRNGNIFHNPIRPSEAPDYYEIVKRPMDLKTIKTRVKDKVITDSSHYQRDIYLMFMNAMMYNRPHSDIYKLAEEVWHFWRIIHD